MNWFLAYPVPTDSGWLETALLNVPEAFRLFAPEDIHLTFAFLGSCGEQAALAAWEQANDLPLTSTSISFAALKPFGPKKKPSAFSLTLDQGHEHIKQAIATHRTALYDAAELDRRDERSPKPHVTIARPGRKASRELIEQGLAWCQTCAIPQDVLHINRMALYTWSTDRRDQLFRIVHERTLPETLF